MNSEDMQLARLESKVDRLTEAVTNLVRVEERQMTHGQRIGALETSLGVLRNQLTASEKRLDSWINRGIGLWSMAIALWSVYLAVGDRLLK